MVRHLGKQSTGGVDEIADVADVGVPSSDVVVIVDEEAGLIEVANVQ